MPAPCPQNPGAGLALGFHTPPIEIFALLLLLAAGAATAILRRDWFALFVGVVFPPWLLLYLFGWLLFGRSKRQPPQGER
ncbi:MAG: hypothetical protein CMJ47_02040 [Planctomyces sp.]|nr:hypothetical protein [Planctomyces sp.]